MGSEKFYKQISYKTVYMENDHMHGCETHYRGTQKIVQSSFFGNVHL